jgi:glycosyltransferase involved in cell wall biosynthesis
VPTAAVISFRLGGTDGVSVESRKWQWALGRLGFGIRTVAGEGPVDRVLPGLAMHAPTPPEPSEIAQALGDAAVVIVENLCSLPLNPGAAAAVAEACHGRPAVLHHHDLPWQRPQFAGWPPPPDDPAWRHVTINELSRAELAVRGIAATTIYNSFDLDERPGAREATRQRVGIGAGTTLVLQPTRALPRKNVPAGLALAEAIGGTYWLLGPAEDGYGAELERLLEGATCPIRHGHDGTVSVADAYAACDVVALPSTWEGFGNPALESAVHQRPLAIGPYPVADELAAFGFEWFAVDRPAALGRWLAHPDPELLVHNREIASRHFSLSDLPGRLQPVLAGMSIDPR